MLLLLLPAWCMVSYPFPPSCIVCVAPGLTGQYNVLVHTYLSLREALPLHMRDLREDIE